MGLILPFRPNKFAFPGGQPGFNPAHPAANGCVASIIPAGANGINILKAQAGASPTVVAKIDGILGPVCFFTAISTPPTFAGVTVISPFTSLTFASISRPIPDGNNNSMISNVSGSGIYQAVLANGNFGIRVLGVVNFDSGIAPVSGVPYFYAASLFYNGTGFNHNHVIVRLDTGQTQTATGVTTTASLNANSSVTWGGYDPTDSGNQSSGPAMFGRGNFLSIPQLLQWAKDPWAFWYPPTLDLAGMLVPTAAPTFTLPGYQPMVIM